MTHSRRTSFDCQLVDAYLVSLQSDIEAKWRDIRSIRDDIHLLMRPRAGASAADSEAVRTITERLDRMLSTNRDRSGHLAGIAEGGADACAGS